MQRKVRFIYQYIVYISPGRKKAPSDVYSGDICRGDLSQLSSYIYFEIDVSQLPYRLVIYIYLYIFFFFNIPYLPGW